MQPGIATGNNGQTIISIIVSIATTTILTKAPINTPTRTTKPTTRLNALSTTACIRSSRLLPGGVVIRFQGANNVLSSCLTEKFSATARSRGLKLLTTCCHPLPYHHEKNAISIGIIVTLIIGRSCYCSSEMPYEQLIGALLSSQTLPDHVHFGLLQ